MKKLSARFVFRSIEFGELAHDRENDFSLHPHMHTLSRLKYLSHLKNGKCYFIDYEHFGEPIVRTAVVLRTFES